MFSHKDVIDRIGGRVSIEFIQILIGGGLVLFIAIFGRSMGIDANDDYLFLRPVYEILLLQFINPFLTSEVILSSFKNIQISDVVKIPIYILGFILFSIKYLYVITFIIGYGDKIGWLALTMVLSTMIACYIDLSHQGRKTKKQGILDKVKTAVLEDLKKAHGNDIENCIEKYEFLSHSEFQPEVRYTNTEFKQHSEKFLKLHQSLFNFINNYRETGFKASCIQENPSRESRVRLVMNHKKGFDGEELVKRTLIKGGVKFIESVNLKHAGTQIEVDFMVIKGNNIVTLEVKDYNAEEIVLDKSGELYKVINGNKEKIEDVLSQVNRHRKFIKDNFPEGINIINLIVLSDKRTRVINNMATTKLQIVVPDFVAYLIEELDSDDAIMEQKIRDITKNLSVPERQFDFFNIEREINEMQTVLAKGVETYNANVEYYSSSLEDLHFDLMSRHNYKHLELYGENTEIGLDAMMNLYKEYSKSFEYTKLEMQKHDLEDFGVCTKNELFEVVS